VNRIHNGKAVWFGPQNDKFELYCMDVIADILWENPGLDGYFIRVDSEEEAERLEREEEV